MKNILRFSPNEIATSGMYQQKGIVLTEVDNRDIDKVTDDAIEVGAEEAEILKEDEKEFIQVINNVEKNLMTAH